MPDSLRTFVRLVALLSCLALVLASNPAHAQVTWSGDNWPPDGGVVDQALPDVAFFYAVFDQGRTEADGRGEGLGTRLFYRDADDTGAAFAAVDMQYEGQTGPFGPNNDLFSVVMPRAAFGSAQRVEYFTVTYDSLATPVHADTTQQDVNGAPPNFVFEFGDELMPHNVFFHFSVCLNGAAGSSVVVRIDPRNGDAPFDVALVQVSPDQIPDLWEGDTFLNAGIARTFEYQYILDEEFERDATGAHLVRQYSLDIGQFTQGPGTDGWQNTGVGCHFDETLSQDVLVHFSVCMAAVPFSGGVCIIGNVPALGNWNDSVELQNLQGQTNSELFEGSVLFPAGSPAVVQYKFQTNDCVDYENPFGSNHVTTNRFFYMDQSATTIVVPTAAWDNERPNLCGPPLAIESSTWTDLKVLFR